MDYKPIQRNFFQSSINDGIFGNWLKQYFVKEWAPKHSSLDLRLYHYTPGLDGLKGIIKDRGFHLTHYVDFADSKEIKYGKDLVDSVIDDNETDFFSCKPVQEFIQHLQGLISTYGRNANGITIHNPFIACFSDSNRIDYQWENYANQKKGYCLGFKFDSDTKISNFNNLADRIPHFRKVIYSSDEQIKIITSYLKFLAENIRCLAEFNSKLDKNLEYAMDAANLILEMISCFKDPSYKGEKEWRLFYAPILSQETQYNLKINGRTRKILQLYDNEGNIPQFPLTEIACGPNCPQDKQEKYLEAFIEEQKMDSDSKIRLGEIKFKNY